MATQAPKVESAEDKVKRVSGLVQHFLENREKMKSAGVTFDDMGKIIGIHFERRTDDGKYSGASWGVVVDEDGGLDVYSNCLI